MMFVSEVTFQSNEASVTMCERCDKFSVIGKRRVDKLTLTAARPLSPKPVSAHLQDGGPTLLGGT